MLCPLCGEPAQRTKSKFGTIEKVQCRVCGRYNISIRAVLLIRQQAYKLDFDGLVRSAQELINHSKKTYLIDSKFIHAYRAKSFPDGLQQQSAQMHFK